MELHVGRVRCEVLALALPCAENARWFLERGFDLMHYRNGAVSRVYALVTSAGTISADDDVVVMPA